MELRIAICDDRAEDCGRLEELLGAACEELGYGARTEVFSRGEDFLLAHGEPGEKPFDIAFMDIFMKGISGVEAVREISAGSKCQFVFTTVSREHAVEAFSLNAAHYLMKPLTGEGVMEALKRCLSRLQKKEEEPLLIRTGRGTAAVPTGSIVYIEVHNKICTLHTTDGSVDTYMSLDSLFALLDKDSFLKAQRSFVVNMRFIKAFFFDHIVLQGGKEISLSRRSRAELKNQYQQFLFRLARRDEL